MYPLCTCVCVHIHIYLYAWAVKGLPHLNFGASVYTTARLMGLIPNPCFRRTQKHELGWRFQGRPTEDQYSLELMNMRPLPHDVPMHFCFLMHRIQTAATREEAAPFLSMG